LDPADSLLLALLLQLVFYEKPAQSVGGIVR